jgi:hypothetical protein
MNNVLKNYSENLLDVACQTQGRLKLMNECRYMYFYLVKSGTSAALNFSNIMLM